MIECTMFYNYLKPFNILCSVFGIRKPSFSATGKTTNTSVIHTIWSLIVITAFIASYCLIVHTPNFDIKQNLQQVSNLNDLVANSIIIALHILSEEETTKNLYGIIISILKDLGLKDKVIKILVQKLYLWFSVVSAAFIVAIVLEIVLSSPPFILLFRIPTFLTLFHLIFHLFLLVAALETLNYYLDNKIDDFTNNYKLKANTLYFDSDKITQQDIVKYCFDQRIRFITEENRTVPKNLDFFNLCKVYDKMTTCIELLIKLHELQIFCVVWLTFSSAVLGISLIACNQAAIPWLAFIKTALPYFWCYLGAYVGDQMRKQVDSTEMILIKHIIDFRNDQSRKNTLETFKQLVGTNRLQFTACNLFDMSYSMVLSMAMNIITYSIILIQIILS